MKVKELIEELQKLDPEKNIWGMEDGYRAYYPHVSVADGSEIDPDIKVGDYLV